MKPGKMWQGAAIFGWWRGQIKSVFPWRRGQPDALIIDVREFGRSPQRLTGRLLARHRGRETFIASLSTSLRLPLGGAWPAVALRLPAAMTLHRELALPAKAERHLKTTLHFEMDRLTPFDPSEVFWSVSALTREKQVLKLTLSLIPRSIVEPLLAALQQMNLTPSFVETGFGPISLGQRNVRHANPVRNALIMVCCTFGLLITLTPFLHQQYRLNAINHQLRELQPRRQVLSSLHQQLAALNAGEIIATAAHENGDELQALAMLSNALPNGSWLDSLSMTPGQVTIDGQSDDAAHLISSLAASTSFTDPSFAGPIMLDDNGAAWFSIQAAISK